MQIKFLTLYHNFNREEDLIEAQRSLLFKWWENTSGCLSSKKSKHSLEIPFISEAKIEFKEYSFFDYYDLEKTKEYVKNSYECKRKKKDGGGIEYWWCGEQYPDLETLYKALAEQKRFMELTITMED